MKNNVTSRKTQKAIAKETYKVMTTVCESDEINALIQDLGETVDDLDKEMASAISVDETGHTVYGEGWNELMAKRFENRDKIEKCATELRTIDTKIKANQAEVLKLNMYNKELHTQYMSEQFISKILIPSNTHRVMLKCDMYSYHMTGYVAFDKDNTPLCGTHDDIYIFAGVHNKLTPSIIPMSTCCTDRIKGIDYLWMTTDVAASVKDNKTTINKFDVTGSLVSNKPSQYLNINNGGNRDVVFADINDESHIYRATSYNALRGYMNYVSRKDKTYRFTQIAQFTPVADLTFVDASELITFNTWGPKVNNQHRIDNFDNEIKSLTTRKKEVYETFKEIGGCSIDLRLIDNKEV